MKTVIKNNLSLVIEHDHKLIVDLIKKKLDPKYSVAILVATCDIEIEDDDDFKRLLGLAPKDKEDKVYVTSDGTLVKADGGTEYYGISWDVIEPGKGFYYRFKPKMMFGIFVTLGFTGFEVDLIATASMTTFCSPDWQENPKWYDDAISELAVTFSISCSYFGDIIAQEGVAFEATMMKKKFLGDAIELSVGKVKGNYKFGLMDDSFQLGLGGFELSIGKKNRIFNPSTWIIRIKFR